MVDRVEISIIEEEQPRWLAFLNDEHDLRSDRAAEFIDAGGAAAASWRPISPSAASARCACRTSDVDCRLSTWKHPVIGGYTPERSRAAPRDQSRATTSSARSAASGGQAIPAQTIVTPGTVRLRPDVPDRDSEYTSRACQGAARSVRLRRSRRRRLARAARRQRRSCWSDATQPDAISRQFDEIWKKNMDDDRHPHRVAHRASGPRT